jgi:hypothetical protein
LGALSDASQQEKKSVLRTDFPAEALRTFAGNALSVGEDVLFIPAHQIKL